MYKYIVLILLIVSPLIGAQQLDPTRPLSSVGQAKSSTEKNNELILQSIINNGHDNNVVISGRLYKVGERVGQYRLTAIKNNSVVLTSRTKTITLGLFSEVVVKSQ